MQFFFWRERELFRAEKKTFLLDRLFCSSSFSSCDENKKSQFIKARLPSWDSGRVYFFPAQVVWNAFSVSLLYLGVNWIGLYTKYLTERAQRKAFLETRRSLEMRFKTQKENERQERLLLSVLPSFVAQQMIRDIAMEEEKALGDFQPDQFHKIYIHRYEQVIY